MYRLRGGKPPVSEPGLSHLLNEGTARGTLQFTTAAAVALRNADVLWVGLDTPIDDAFNADVDIVDIVVASVERASPTFEEGRWSSCRLSCPSGRPPASRRPGCCPFGATTHFRLLTRELAARHATSGFLDPARIVVGLRTRNNEPRVRSLFGQLADQIVWVSVEAAEMAKRAMNAFLGTSVAFANELATRCECASADAQQVEQALRSDPRIGSRAYIFSGAAFAGGTLSRDLEYLAALGRSTGVATPLLDGVQSSNDQHRHWAWRTLAEELGDLLVRRIALLGLTYQPGTSTVRRSEAVELASLRYLTVGKPA